MKQGCIVILAIWAGMSMYYRSILPAETASEKWWIWVLLGLSVALIAAQIWALWLAIKKKRAASRGPDSWRDGDLVGVSGRIQAVRGAGKSPISGKPVLISEYQVKRISGSGKNRSEVTEYNGFLMVPCAIQTNRGMIRLFGFPLLTSFHIHNKDDFYDFSHIGEHLASAKVTELPSNPFKVLREFTNVLKDEDGDVQVDFGRDILTDFNDAEDFDSASVISDAGEAELDDEELREELRDRPVPTNRIAARFMSSGYHLFEQAVAPGAEVTAFGTYRAAQRAVDVGSGISNLSHTLEPGPIGKVVGKAIRSALIFLVIWSAVSVAGHLAVFPELRGKVEAYFQG